MLLKCCTQYVSKFGKLSSGHRTGKKSVIIPIQKKGNAKEKNVQTTTQLHSFHMPIRQCTKSYELGFNNAWTENFQMYKLVSEKAEEPEIKLPTSIGSWKSEGIPGKHILVSLATLKLLTVWIITKWKILKEMGIPEHLNCLLRSLCAGQEATVRTQQGTTEWFQIGKGVWQGCISSPLFI